MPRSHRNDEKPREARESEQAHPGDTFKALSDEFETFSDGRLKVGIGVGFAHLSPPFNDDDSAIPIA